MSYSILASVEDIQAEREYLIKASVAQYGAGLMKMNQSAARNPAVRRTATQPKPAPMPQRSPGAQSQHLYGQFDPSKHVRHQDGGYAPINRTGTARTWGAGIRKSA